MPSFLEPLAPDGCRSDPSAPCHWHLKLRALNGGFDTLTEQERDFIGVRVPARAHGWLALTARGPAS